MDLLVQKKKKKKWRCVGFCTAPAGLWSFKEKKMSRNMHIRERKDREKADRPKLNLQSTTNYHSIPPPPNATLAPVFPSSTGIAMTLTPIRTQPLYHYRGNTNQCPGTSHFLFIIFWEQLGCPPFQVSFQLIINFCFSLKLWDHFRFLCEFWSIANGETQQQKHTSQAGGYVFSFCFLLGVMIGVCKSWRSHKILYKYGVGF